MESIGKPAKLLQFDPRPQISPTSPPFGGRSDEELMLLARGGMKEAFEELVRRHQLKVLRIASKYLGNSTLAKDIGQNTFLEIYRALSRYKTSGSFRSYLFRVLINQCHMAHRRMNYEKLARQTIVHSPSAREPELLETQLIAEEKRKEVEAALLKLSRKLRSVIVLRFSGDLSYQEIAEILDVPLGTVKRRLFDGLEKLRLILEQS